MQGNASEPIGWYDSAYYEHIAQFSARDKYRAELEYILPSLKLTQASSLLDIGCGTGSAMRYVRDTIGCKIRGYEVSQSTQSFVQDLDVTYGDGLSLPFPDSSFDAVHLIHVIGHAREPLELMREALRVLRPGGRIGIVTPNRGFILCHRPLNKLGLIPYRRDPTVMHFYMRRDLEAVLHDAGFCAIQTEYFGKPPAFMRSFPLLNQIPIFRERVVAIAARPDLR